MTDQINGFHGPFRFLSNFDERNDVTFYIDGDGDEKIPCKTIEHAFQALKAASVLERRAVASASTPGKAKRLGKKIESFRADWNEVRVNIMLELLCQKFSHEYYKELLLATGDAELIENNTWGDVYWGVCDGVGENVLGRLLMQVREALR